MTAAAVLGRTVHYAEAAGGTPDAADRPTLVLLHGFPMDHTVWAGQLAGLAGVARVIAPDLRGFGRSAASDPFTIDDAADDVHALVEAVAPGPVVVAGLSMGGYVALAMAERHPASLRGLVLIDTKAAADDEQGRQNRDAMIEQVRTGGPPAVAAAMLPKLLAPATLTGRPDVAVRVRAMMEAVPPSTLEHALRAMRDRPDRTATLAAVTVPVQIVVGELDAATPVAVARQMRATLPAAPLAVIPAAGHLTPVEQPAAVTAVLAAFMADVTADVAGG